MSNALRIFVLLSYVASLHGMSRSNQSLPDNDSYFFIYPKELTEKILLTPAAKSLYDEVKSTDYQNDNRYQVIANLLGRGADSEEFVSRLDDEVAASCREKKMINLASILLLSLSHGYRPGFRTCCSLRDQINQEYDLSLDQLARVIQAASHKVRVLLALDSLLKSASREHQIGPSFALLSDPDYLCEHVLERLRQGRSPNRVQQLQQKNLTGSCP